MAAKNTPHAAAGAAPPAARRGRRAAAGHGARRRHEPDWYSPRPALPLHSAGKYVAGAYIVFFALVLIYVAIMADAAAVASSASSRELIAIELTRAGTDRGRSAIASRSRWR